MNGGWRRLPLVGLVSVRSHLLVHSLVWQAVEPDPEQAALISQLKAQVAELEAKLEAAGGSDGGYVGLNTRARNVRRFQLICHLVNLA